MPIIVGLGNPGIKYRQTRHNIGFRVVEAIADRLGADWRLSRRDQALIAQIDLKGLSCLLVKPQTFINQSGQTILALTKYHSKDLVNLVVVHDDLDLGLGTIRIRQGGSSAGHNGLESIIQTLGRNFWRVRIGISHPRQRAREEGIARNPLEYVLQKFSSDESRLVKRVVDQAAGLIVSQCQAGSGLKEQTITL